MRKHRSDKGETFSKKKKTKAKLARKQAAFVSTLNQLHPGEVQVGIWRQYGRGPLAALKMQNELDPNTDISRNDSAARALQLICGTSNCSFSLLALYDRLFFFLQISYSEQAEFLYKEWHTPI